MDDKIIKLISEMGNNAVYAFIIYEIADFLKLGFIICSFGYGVNWLYKKAKRDLD
jgi:hypothetical protein